MSRNERRRGPLRILLRLIAGGLSALLAAAVIAGLLASQGPPLPPWQRATLDGEIRADAPAPDWNDYLRREASLFEQVRALMRRQAEPGCGRLDRYCPGSESDPFGFDRDWNRTFERSPLGEPKGAALLLHGLLDSPYSMRAPAETLRDRGYFVVGLRLPGHGTIPAELERTVRDDWRTAVRLAARYASARAPGELVVGGYSNGGLLALDYALDAAQDRQLPPVDRLYLFAPALGLDRIAGLAWWPRLIRWVDAFEPARWLAVRPEVDPFRYYSMPYQGIEQCYRLAWEVRRRLEGQASDLPSTVTFHSAVDATVALGPIEELHRRLSGPGNELVLFGVNEALEATGLFDRVPAIERLQADSPGFAVTILRNPLGGWPTRAHSVAHIGVMIPAGDQLYGRLDEWEEPPTDRFHFEKLRILAERGQREFADAELTRLRYNPFWPEVSDRLR